MDLNQRPFDYKSSALPTELNWLDARDGIEPSITLLQRAVLPFDHLAIVGAFTLLGPMHTLASIPIDHRSRLFKFLIHNEVILSHFYTRVKKKIKNKKKEIGNV